jgi:ATP-dependent Clp protease adaptor protein ClpS
MSDTEILEKTETKEEVGQSKELLLHNDDYNTFEHVEKCMMSYVGMSTEQAAQVAHIVHYRGKCSIKRGDDRSLKKLYFKLKLEGLSVTIETA